MMNPWLEVPLDDYEGHMRAAGVGQLDVLSDLFAEALVRCRPKSVAILGVAGGNGLERIDAGVTRRVVGIDINPEYLDITRQRFLPSAPGLELHCVDLAADLLKVEPVDLVHAALIFEHAGAKQCLENALSLAAPGGGLSVVLQLPSEIEQDVGLSEFPSVQKLSADFTLIDPPSFIHILKARHFRVEHQQRRSLPSGKAFWMGMFRA